MIKKLLLTLLILNIFTVTSLAMTNEEFLLKAETELYDTEFSFEPYNLRLNRIEKTVLGKNLLNKPISSRISNLKNIFKHTEIIKPQYPKLVEIQPTGMDEKYPIVDNIEQKVFGKIYLNENIYTRLTRLEQKLFNQSFTDALTDRVNRLKTIVLNYQPPSLKHKKSFDTFSLANSDFLQKELYNMEMKVYGNSYTKDTTQARLNRLENHFFSTTSTNMKDEDRLDRLAAVVDAKENQPASDALVKASRASRWATVAGIAGMVIMVALSAFAG